MLLKDLKARLETITQKEQELLARHNAKIAAIKKREQKVIESYLDKHARYKVGEKVWWVPFIPSEIEKVEGVEVEWEVGFIDKRTINRETWDINYYTRNVKKDGSPGNFRPGFPYPESHFKPYKNK